MAWSFIAQRAVTGEFLDWDVPLRLEGLEWQLSGPGSLKASLEPDVGALRASDGLLLLEEWGTLLHAEHGGIIRWSGILISSSFSGESWNIEAAGYSAYPHSRIYRGDYVQIQVDPAEVVGHIWNHIQSFPDSNLGVSVVGDSTPVRLGELAYATDENGTVLDLAIPHKQWFELFDLEWQGGPVHKVHVSDDLWNWLYNKGFQPGPVHPQYGESRIPPATWTEEFPWWESEILNLGWVGGPVRAQDVRPELFDYLRTHGWVGLSTDSQEQVYPPTTEPDPTLYPHDVWPALFALGWVGGPVRQVDVPEWIWSTLLGFGWTDPYPDGVSALYPPADQQVVGGLQSWETDLVNLGWVGGPVRRQDVSESLWNTLVKGNWRGRRDDPVEQVWYPNKRTLPLDENDVVVEAAPYELLWWESPNCGEEIADLIERTPMDFVERHRWDEAHENIIHEIELGYPRIGRRRDDLLFEQGVNVIEVVTVESNGDEFANSVIGLGAGEGRAVLRRETGLRDGRLSRDHLYADKAVTDPAQMDARIAAELAARKAAIRITSLSVIDHPSAVLGSWQLGDDVLVRAHLPWLGEIEMWVRITGWSLTGETTATLSVSRSDLFHYGG